MLIHIRSVLIKKQSHSSSQELQIQGPIQRLPTCFTDLRGQLSSVWDYGLLKRMNYKPQSSLVFQVQLKCPHQSIFQVPSKEAPIGIPRVPDKA